MCFVNHNVYHIVGGMDGNMNYQIYYGNVFYNAYDFYHVFLYCYALFI